MGNIGLILLGEVTGKNGQVICPLPSWFKFKNTANSFAGASGNIATEISVYPQGVICYSNEGGISLVVLLFCNKLFKLRLQLKFLL